MKKLIIVLATAGILATPAGAHAAKPSKIDKRAATTECRAERGNTAETREAFAARYRNLGACVTRTARAERAERVSIQAGARKACRVERGNTAETRAAFTEKYGTGRKGRNAYGKCVSAAAKLAKAEVAAEELAEIEGVHAAAEQCASERGDTAESRAAFAQQYGTNANKRNAFGKCVSKVAKSLKADDAPSESELEDEGPDVESEQGETIRA